MGCDGWIAMVGVLWCACLCGCVIGGVSCLCFVLSKDRDHTVSTFSPAGCGAFGVWVL